MPAFIVSAAIVGVALLVAVLELSRRSAVGGRMEKSIGALRPMPRRDLQISETSPKERPAGTGAERDARRVLAKPEVVPNVRRAS